MNYTLAIDNTSNICTVRVTGDYQSPQDGIELQKLSLQIYAGQGCRLFLYDMTRAQIISGTLQAFALANPKAELAEGLRNLRGAVVYPSLTVLANFFETVAVNRGFQIRVFDDHTSAVNWLQQLS